MLIGGGGAGPGVMWVWTKCVVFCMNPCSQARKYPTAATVTGGGLVPTRLALYSLAIHDSICWMSASEIV